MVKLQIKDEAGKTTTVPLVRDEITIGRKEGNTIRLTERNVSRTHARFLKKGDEIHLEDLSRYGTRVNGERITASRRIGAGDVVAIGDYQLSLEGAKAVEHTPDAKLAAAGAAALAPSPAELRSSKDGKKKAAEIEKAAKDQIAAAKAEAAEKIEEKKPPTVPPGYAVKTVPGDASAEDIRRSLGAGKKRIGANTPTLVAVTGTLAGQEFPITGQTMILGRTGENDIKVDHHSISRNHAKVVVTDGRVKMVDLQSKNGIRVNGEFWEESVLKSGDVVELGKVQFRFVEKGEEFIFRPEDWKEGASTAAAPDAKKKGGKTWLVLLLLAVVGGLAAVLVITSGGPDPKLPQPNTTPSGGTSATVTTAPATTQVANAPDAGSAATNAPPETKAPETKAPPQVDNTAAIKEALSKAKTAVAAQKWDDADKQLQMVLALDKENAEAQAMAQKVAAERSAAAAFDEAQAAQAKGDLQVAWAALQRLANLAPESVYYARAQELKNAVGPAIANGLMEQAKAANQRKAWVEAIGKAEDALKIVPNLPEATDLIAKARKAKQKDDEKKAADAAKNPDPNKPDPNKPPTGATADDLYKQARALHNSDPAAALKLYEQAAAKGYAAAYKQIGSIKVKFGDIPGAIAAYKRYLSLVPDARDADMVKDIIVRLGGSP